jgi:hypothetical protein
MKSKAMPFFKTAFEPEKNLFVILDAMAMFTGNKYEPMQVEKDRLWNLALLIAP